MNIVDFVDGTRLGKYLLQSVRTPNPKPIPRNSRTRLMGR